MRDFLDMVARIAVYAGTVGATVILLAAVSASVIFGTFGTGGFTADTLPDHTPWLGIAIALTIWLALQWGVLRLHRMLISALDRFALRH